jgi:hypothetical protein
MMAEKNAKAAMVAAVSVALDYKERNPKATNAEIISYVVNNSGKILQNID